MKNFISNLIARVQAAWPVNRVVAAITPLLALAAGGIGTYAVQKLPWIGSLVPNTQAMILGVFVTVAAAAVTSAYKWLDGWQKHEDRQHWAAADNKAVLADEQLDKPDQDLPPRPLSEEPEVSA